jgi:hypothetical protein
MLAVVLYGKARTRLRRRRPVLVDRRQPERAWLREAIDGRGVSRSLRAVEREVTELTTADPHLTTGDPHLAEELRRSE